MRKWIVFQTKYGKKFMISVSILIEILVFLRPAETVPILFCFVYSFYSKRQRMSSGLCWLILQMLAKTGLGLGESWEKELQSWPVVSTVRTQVLQSSPLVSALEGNWREASQTLEPGITPNHSDGECGHLKAQCRQFDDKCTQVH